MKIKNLFRCFTAIAVAVMLASAATAQITVAEWNFNAATGPQSASTGTGTVSGGFFPLGGFGPPFVINGSPDDPNPVPIGNGLNNAAAGRSGPEPTDADGPDSIRSLTIQTSTVSFEGITVSWHALQGYRASRYHQLYATTDGTTFLPVPTGTGSTAAILGSATLAPNGFPQTTQSATVSNDGLVTIISDNNMIPSGLIDNQTTGDAFVRELSYTFPTGMGFDNNPNFAVRISAVHEPGGTEYVSSFAGTDSTDLTDGYIRDSAAGGNSTLYDLIRITAAVPEPSSLVMAVCGLTLLGGRRRR